MRPLSLLSAALVAMLVLAAAAAAGGRLRALREGGDVRGQAATSLWLTRRRPA